MRLITILVLALPLGCADKTEDAIMGSPGEEWTGRLRLVFTWPGQGFAAR